MSTKTWPGIRPFRPTAGQNTDAGAGAHAPIGVFDSGIGGLSVLRALRVRMPQEHFVYLADTAHAPYGERGDDFVRERTLAIAESLRAQHRIKALVVACNTATAAAIADLRAQYPGWIVVGVEPALRPAAARSRSGRVAVMATRGTLESDKFADLLRRQRAGVQFALQPCDGLADAIERSATGGGADAQQEMEQLCRYYVQALAPFGDQRGQADVLVLGCTHYVFAQPLLQRLVGPGVRLMETGQPVARRTHELLQRADLLAPANGASGGVQLLSSARPAALRAAAARWLGARAVSGAASSRPVALPQG